MSSPNIVFFEGRFLAFFQYLLCHFFEPSVFATPCFLAGFGNVHIENGTPPPAGPGKMCFFFYSAADRPSKKTHFSQDSGTPRLVISVHIPGQPKLEGGPPHRSP